jgi:hypothetical protein
MKLRTATITSFTPPPDTSARYARITDAAKRGPFSRSRLYLLAGERKIAIRKDGRKSIVDLDQIDAIASSLPVAEVPDRKNVA